MNDPLVSIVMPSFNQGRFIGCALDSVLSQSWRRLELIVMDGGSCDHTPTVLERTAAQDHRLRWFSEADQGPAHAVNKALARCKGTLIGWLNADDRYTPGAVQQAADALQQRPEWILVYGHGEHIDAQGDFIDRYPTRPPDTPIQAFAEGCFICQPSVFFKRSLYLLQGPLNQTLQTAFDFDYWLRAFRLFPGRIGFIHRVLAQSRLHQDCITRKQRRTIAFEALQLLHQHLGYAPPHWWQSYAIEYLADPSAAVAAADQRAHLEQTLAEASPYLMVTDRAALQTWLDQICASAGTVA